MRPVGELVLVLGLLVSVHCEVRARDPEVEEEEEDLRGRAGGEGGGGGSFWTGAFPPHPQRLHPGATETPPLGKRGNHVTRYGNWCAFVQRRVVTTAVLCGTEKYIIKSQSPCLSGSPNCPMVLYKLSTQPMYTQSKKTITTLQWRCCPGHGGHNCEDTVPDPQLDSGSAPNRRPEPERAELRGPGVHMQLQQQIDPNREQNDNPHTSQQQEPRLQESPAVISVPQVVALVMSHLQPVLEGFNRSLEHLSWQVGDLAHDVAQLKSSRWGAERQTAPPEGPELDEAAEERLEAKLDEVFQNIREVQRQVESQRTDMEDGLHSQHAMLHYNLTSFKTDIDMKLKRHQKTLQVSLQAMNTTLSELKLDDHLPFPALSPRPSDSSALWDAIERLDDAVVNNTVKVTALTEDVEVTAGSVQQLRWDLKELEKQINQTARSSRILFMETGLEVEDAKVAVLKRVEELAGNLAKHKKQLQEQEDDVDYLYTLCHNNTHADCGCTRLEAAVARLERGVANVTALANDNRLALDENSEGGVEQWGEPSDWEPAVERLQRGLQHVQESLASEQSRTRTLDLGLTQLSSSVAVGLAEVSDMKERDKNVREEIQRLTSSFKSLLKDAIRHSDVLDLLLGEEVLEFLEWPVQDQVANSIPALKEQLRNLQEQLRQQSLSITSLLSNRPGSREEVPSADQPSSSSSSSSHLVPGDWYLGGMRRSDSGVPAREQQLLLHPDGRRPEHRGDGSDLWNLEKRVEELGLKVVRLAEKPCPCSNSSTEGETPSGGVDTKLQAEVMWLKRGLEEHLGVFKNVFSNADVLAASRSTLELDKLWQMVKDRDREGKKGKKRGGGGGGGGDHRHRRDSSGVVPVPSGQSEDSLLFVAGSPLRVLNSVVVFEASLNQGLFYSDTGSFTAPVDGVYLFILTLDWRPGPAHMVLRRGSGGGLVWLHRQEVTEAGPTTGVGLLQLRKGEVVRLELRGGAWAESEDNVFTGMLLHQTT
ncbi:multimerin-2a [Toxotes jaculatrix]|uniref:multimerin-2a n=1 Tax=Toxotes jaculatrix TaxID=941984 RepID=UPI001B3A9DA8|nr:multimerin-2a [Toxotes jaculatrix]